MHLFRCLILTLFDFNWFIAINYFGSLQLNKLGVHFQKIKIPFDYKWIEQKKRTFYWISIFYVYKQLNLKRNSQSFVNFFFFKLTLHTTLVNGSDFNERLSQLRIFLFFEEKNTNEWYHRVISVQIYIKFSQSCKYGNGNI